MNKKKHYCEICGEPAEEHHIVLRRKSSGMINAKINHKYLCIEHHKGNEGPHLNRETDIKYKLELQEKLSQLFNKEYYHKLEISELLEIKHDEVDVLVKMLKWCSKGYERTDIIRACMGGKLYDKQTRKCN